MGVSLLSSRCPYTNQARRWWPGTVSKRLGQGSLCSAPPRDTNKRSFQGQGRVGVTPGFSKSNPTWKVPLPGLACPNNQPDLLTALCRGPPGCHRSLPADPRLARPATWALPGLPAQLCRLRGGPFRRAASRRLRGPREPRDAITGELQLLLENSPQSSSPNACAGKGGGGKR